MKKHFLLPLSTLMSALVLSACSSHTPAPVVEATDSTILSPGVMIPVTENSEWDTNNTWQTDIQPTEMPAVMTTPIPQPISTEIPSSYSVPQPLPSYNEPLSNTPKTTPKAVKSNISQTTLTDFTIPRDENNAPIYSQIKKGFYTNETYTVRKGDTMFLIAYIAGKDVKKIAEMNNMSEPYQLYVGRVLKVNTPQQVVAQNENVAKVEAEPAVTYTRAPNGTAYGSDGTVTGPIKATTSTVQATPQVIASVATDEPIKATTATNKTAIKSSIKWQWPTEGQVIQHYSSREGGNPGIDIAGTKGQAVKAAAAGRVVFIGTKFKGFGKMVMIKHNEEFMTVYAHNDTIKVKEQQEVKAGQTIATLGNSEATSYRLHFQIRHNSVTIDPLPYLPKR